MHFVAVSRSLNYFKLRGVIGCGSYGIGTKCTNRLDNKSYAIKIPMEAAKHALR